MSYYARPWSARLGDFIGKVIVTVIDFFEDFGFWVTMLTGGVIIAGIFTYLFSDENTAQLKNAENVVQRFGVWAIFAEQSCTKPTKKFELGTNTLTYECTDGKTYVLDQDELDRAAHCSSNRCEAKDKSIPVIDLATIHK